MTMHESGELSPFQLSTVSYPATKLKEYHYARALVDNCRGNCVTLYTKGRDGSGPLVSYLVNADTEAILREHYRTLVLALC
jgi:hypothetical protein